MNALRPPGRAWLALCALLATGSGLAWGLPTAALDWQPARAFSEPWRLLTAACVHFSALHLAANLAGTALVAALGWVARAPAALAAAWALSWPLTHAALAWQPALLHYGGASGVLHGGVAAVAVWLLARAETGRARMLAGAIAIGLAVKLVLEQPWGPPLRQVPGWDIAIAPLAHATGALGAAVLAAALAAALVAARVAVRARRQRPRA